MSVPASGTDPPVRVLIVTPEVAVLPEGLSLGAECCRASPGNLAYALAHLVAALRAHGLDVHVALPNYRGLFQQYRTAPGGILDFSRQFKSPCSRVHLAEDRIFYYQSPSAYYHGWERKPLALAFQREVINDIIPRVNPDLVHCHDWMTGVIPPMLRQTGIPSVFTLHNAATLKVSMADMEDRGIDAAAFWNQLYFDRYPLDYAESRESNPVDLLATGIFGAQRVTAAHPRLVDQITAGQRAPTALGQRPRLNQALTRAWSAKAQNGTALGLSHEAQPRFNPASDPALFRRYSAPLHGPAKQFNKLFIQEKLGLTMDSQAPLFFWSTPIEALEAHCAPLVKILQRLLIGFQDENAQFLLVSEGPHKSRFESLLGRPSFNGRVALGGAREVFIRQACAGADFVLAKFLGATGGLPEKIGPLYGALPVVFSRESASDWMAPFAAAQDRGNGFLVDTVAPAGILKAVEAAMDFYRLPREVKGAQIERIMEEAAARQDGRAVVSAYMTLYDQLLARSLN